MRVQKRWEWVVVSHPASMLSLTCFWCSLSCENFIWPTRYASIPSISLTTLHAIYNVILYIQTHTHVYTCLHVLFVAVWPLRYVHLGTRFNAKLKGSEITCSRIHNHSFFRFSLTLSVSHSVPTCSLLIAHTHTQGKRERERQREREKE